MEERKEHPTAPSAKDRFIQELQRLRARIKEVEQARSEPLAIVGLACRFPGVESLEDCWAALRVGGNYIVEVPPDRFQIDAFYDPDPEAVGKTYCRYGGFLHDVDAFDAELFRISPREAMEVDPQQRLMLELCWEALEDAAIPPLGLVGQDVGVFVGTMNTDYRDLQIRAGVNAITSFTAAQSTSFAAGRTSFVFGLMGPSVTVNTVCSSSIVALHLASLSLRARECPVALVGAVHVIHSPDRTLEACRYRGLSPEGQCHTFDAAADGYVRSEGAFALVLKPLSRALADGDQVRALVRGSAFNQDGPSTGLKAPSGPAQEAVIRAATASAGLPLEAVAYLETHGTGTSLGDLIEVSSIGATYGEGRVAERRLALGSAKTNFGHLEAAAGGLGVVKTVLCLEHEELAPQIPPRALNPLLDFEGTSVTVVGERTPWPAGDGPRVAALSSFGLSGTNSHVLIEEPPSAEARTSPRRAQSLLVLSARDDAALRELAGRYERWLAAHPEVPFEEVCATAATGRLHLPRRLAVVAPEGRGAARRLALWAAGVPDESIVEGPSRTAAPPVVGFLFSGHGSSYPGMGRELFEESPPFRRVMERADEILRPSLRTSLLEVLYGSRTDLLLEMEYAQPALFALQLALVELWSSLGVRPRAALGHSAGEYSAACLAGVFSLEHGLALTGARGRLMQSLPRTGAMAAVMEAEERVAEVIAGLEGTVVIATQNAPSNTVISGERGAVEAACERFRAMGVETRLLNIPLAAHSPLVDPILDDFEREARAIDYGPARIGVVSNVTGRLAEPEELSSAAYWRRHLRAPVRFRSGLEALAGLGADVFIELGPKATLLGLGTACVPDESKSWLPSLRESKGAWEQVLASLGAVYVRGGEIDWGSFYREHGSARRAGLPTYPFQRQRLWFDWDASRLSIPSPASRWRVLLDAARGHGAGSAAPRDRAELARRARETVSAVLAILPSESRVRLLALEGRGAMDGTTAASSVVPALLAALPANRLLCDFAAPSSEALAAARARVEPYNPGVRYRELDLDGAEPPPPEPEAYDLLLLDGVLGGVRVPSRVAARLRSLLAPEGVVLLLEKEPPASWARLFEESGFVRSASVAAQDGAGLLLVAQASPAAPVPSKRAFSSLDPEAAKRRGRVEWSRHLGAAAAGGDRDPDLPLAPMLARRLEAALPIFETRIGPAAFPFLHDHRAFGGVLVPAAAYVESLLSALRVTAGDAGGAELGNLVFREPLAATAGSPDPIVQVVLPPAGGPGTLRVFGRAGEAAPWRLLVEAEAEGEAAGDGAASEGAPGWVTGQELPPGRRVGHDEVYAALGRIHLDYGPAFRGIEALWLEGSSVVARVVAPASLSTEGYRLHPVLLDACFHMVAAARALTGPREELEGDRAIVPVSIDRIRVRAGFAPAPLWCRADLHPASREATRADLTLLDGDGGIIARIDGLTLRGATEEALRPGSARADAGLLYAPSWRPRAPGGSTPPPGEGSRGWLLLADEGGCFEELARRVGALGEPLTLVRRGGAHERLADGSFRIDPTDPLSFDGLLREVRHPVTEIVDLFGLDAVVGERTTPEGIAAALDAGCVAVLHLVQALGRLGKPAVPRLTLVTSGAMAVSPDDGPGLAPAAAPLWGLAKSLSNEHPELGCRCVDLLPAAEGIPLLWEELASSDGEREVAFRRAVRFVRRLLPLEAGPLKGRPRVRGEGVYLITGGLGGLGLGVAAWLIDLGARHLVLVGRRPPSTEAQAKVERLAERADVRIVLGDISSSGEVARILSALPGPLAGVFHAAGVLRDATLERQDRAGFAATFPSKAVGAWLLHEATRGLDLDFFVSFSSVAALFGPPGQANHAAACAFEDALAHHRRASGRRALSVNWGLWSQIGVGVTAKVMGGVESFTPVEAFGALERLLLEDRTEAAVTRMDWPGFARGLPSRPPFFEEVAPMTTPTETPREGEGERSLLERLGEAAPPRRRRILTEHLRDAAAGVLKLDAASVDTQTPLMEIGFDSLMAMEMNRGLAKSLQRPVPASLIFRYPSIEAMTEHLLRELYGDEASAAAPAEAVAAPGAEGARSSSGEIEDLLSEVEGMDRDSLERELEK
jgi:acyl transferase domain-containing protein